MTKATDKWGREFKTGDLFRVQFHPVARLLSEFSGAKDDDGFFTAKQTSGGGVLFWEPHDGSCGLEILARGHVADPVPESFEPVRDEAGRPVLGCCNVSGHMFIEGVCAKCGAKSDELRFGKAIAEKLAAPRVDQSQTRHGCYDHYLGQFICGMNAGRQAESVQAITCPDCRAAIKADPYAPPGFDPWATAKTIADLPPLPGEMDRFRICEITFGDDPPIVVPPQPSLDQRYAAFCETVERVVLEEAPAVRVVTDWSEKPWGGKKHEGPRGFAELRLDDYRVTFSCALHSVDVEAWERDTRVEIEFMRDALGAREMGAKK